MVFSFKSYHSIVSGSNLQRRLLLIFLFLLLVFSLALLLLLGGAGVGLLVDPHQDGVTLCQDQLPSLKYISITLF